VGVVDGIKEGLLLRIDGFLDGLRLRCFCDGFDVGRLDKGFSEGLREGFAMGFLLGLRLRMADGRIEGLRVGFLCEGFAVGLFVIGCEEGIADGFTLGFVVGRELRTLDAFMLGLLVLTSVGRVDDTEFGFNNSVGDIDGIDTGRRVEGFVVGWKVGDDDPVKKFATT
jgi:hypothetical protein